jgi:hypothetical protein
VETFDPYFKWLAIPPAEQPPNHYRLLGVPLFVDDPDVIDNAADQRMSHIRSFQTGKRSAESQRLLNEIAVARNCLLDPSKRHPYDEQLRAELAPAPSPPMQAPIPVTTDTMASHPVEESPGPDHAPSEASPIHIAVKQRKPRKAKSPALEVLKAGLGAVVGLSLAYLILSLINPSFDVLGLLTVPSSPVSEADRVVRSGDRSGPPDEPEAVDTNANDTNTPPEANPDEPDASPDSTVVGSNPAPDDTSRPSSDDPNSSDPNSSDLKPGEPSTDDPTSSEPPLDPQAAKQAKLASLQAERAAAIERFDVAKTLALIQESSELTQQDSLPVQVQVLDEFKERASDADQYRLVSEALLKLVDSAVEAGRHEIAKAQLERLIDSARKSNDQRLVNEATLRVVDIQTGQ